MRFPPSPRSAGARRSLAAAVAALACAVAASSADAHEQAFPVRGDKMEVRTSGGKNARRFAFKASEPDLIRVANHDPANEGAALVIRGLGEIARSSGRIELIAKKWTAKQKNGKLSSYVYKDAKGKAGGITKVVLKNGKITVKGKGANWAWKPKGEDDEVWVHFFLEEEQYCAVFSGGSGDVAKNKKGLFQASGAVAPGQCPEQICGNGEVELGEQCDDGNLDDTDSCTARCEGTCEEPDFASTFDAIQTVIFDNPDYGCTNGICHDVDEPEGGLDLTAGSSWENLVSVDSSADPDRVRVFPADTSRSILYLKLLEKFEASKALAAGDEPGVEIQGIAPGAGMPSSGFALREEHLEGLAAWIRAGAPLDATVLGTDDKFGSCLPDPDPLKIDPPPPPADGEGVQFVSTAWPLPSQSEGEVCMASFYDFTGTGLVPEAAKVPCPSRFERDEDKRTCYGNLSRTCTEDADCDQFAPCIVRRNAANPDGECFGWRAQELVQDPQSHHSIIYAYTGAYDEAFDGDDPNDVFPPGVTGWGPWTYKFDDPEDPRNGDPCDPTEIDPELGYNLGCSGRPVPGVACIGTHVPDLFNFNIAGGGDDGGTLPQFSGSQETYYKLDFAEGVYTELPMRGIILWNSHAFNLTNADTTMNQYLTLDFADEAGEREHQAIQLFDADNIFTQYVEPFETQEYCATYTLPEGSRLYSLSSHMHSRGVLWRTWEPPNSPCKPDCDSEHVDFGFIANCNFAPLPICEGAPERDPDYTSTVYNDPLQLTYDPPLAYDSASIEDRTYLYCTKYDNGSTVSGPAVKTFSGSPATPLAGLPGVGGPCANDERRCMAGPNRGQECAESLTAVPEATFCETEPSLGDGSCDACPLRGGVTTEDEMMILLGNYYVVPPGS